MRLKQSICNRTSHATDTVVYNCVSWCVFDLTAYYEVFEVVNRGTYFSFTDDLDTFVAQLSLDIIKSYDT